MLLAYLLRETGLGLALTKTRTPQRNRSESISPKKSEASTNSHPSQAHTGLWVSPTKGLGVGAAEQCTIMKQESRDALQVYYPGL